MILKKAVSLSFMPVTPSQVIKDGSRPECKCSSYHGNTFHNWEVSQCSLFRFETKPEVLNKLHNTYVIHLSLVYKLR